jgi:hypothetical protein
MGVSHDRKCVVHGHREPDVSLGQKFWPDGLRSDEVLRHRALGDLPNDEVLHRRVNRALGVNRGQKCVLRGRRSETCCGGQEVLGSSRGACRHRQLGERRVNHASHVPGVRHDRRCAERGLPNVMKVRQFLLRVACVDRGRRLPKHPCGELI